MIKFFGSLLFCLFLTSTIFAQQYCGTTNYGYNQYNQNYAHNYTSTVTNYPVAIPVLVPATVFQYTPALQQFNQPAVSFVPQQNPQQQTQAVGIDNAKLNQLVEARVKDYLEKLNAADLPPALPGQKYNNPTEESLVTKVANILAPACVSCHTKGIDTKGGVVLFEKVDDETVSFKPNVSPSKIYEALKPPSPAMPPSANRDINSPNAVSGINLDVIKSWAGKS